MNNPVPCSRIVSSKGVLADDPKARYESTSITIKTKPSNAFGVIWYMGDASRLKYSNLNLFVDNWFRACTLWPFSTKKILRYFVSNVGKELTINILRGLPSTIFTGWGSLPTKAPSESFSSNE